ncbi:MAG: TatD family hydrolase [Clostridia bacterium]|nr:TatD family hydrolase [Clostridia bacterium]
MMIDIHAHYDDDAFDDDRDKLLQSLLGEKGVNKIINAGCNIETSEASIRLAEKYENVYAVVGFHPNDAHKMTDDDFEYIKKMLDHPKVLGIGEIGLDYHWDTSHKEIQKEVFRKHLELAVERDLPVVIHERDSIADCLEIVLDYNVKGVFHAFSGSKETAKILLDRGWYISFPGTVTFKNAKHPPENAAFVPEDRILTETDSPYLTAHPFRGKRNDSGYMTYTLEKIAEIRGTDFEHIERITEANAKRLFGF